MTNEENKSDFSREIGKKEARKLRARRSEKRSIWFGFSMFGLVGWSVMVPTVLGTLLGLWLDKHYPGSHSWTLTFLIVGLILGALNAWYWVEKESREIQNEQDRKEQPENKKSI